MRHARVCLCSTLGGRGNLRDSEFEVSYAIAMGGVATVALLAHTDCGMSRVTQKRSAFVAGLNQRGGWAKDAAGTHFDRYAARYQIEESPALAAPIRL